MPTNSTVFRIFVASPGDVQAERAALEAVVQQLNPRFIEQYGIMLDPVMWETNTYPGIGADPQDVINRQIRDDYDIFIGIMWARFGTPTNRAESGTQEEFERAYGRYRSRREKIRIMFYFKDAPVAMRDVDAAQLAKVQEFRSKAGELGLYTFSFQDTADFTRLLYRHLNQLVLDLHQELTGQKKEPTAAPEKGGGAEPGRSKGPAPAGAGAIPGEAAPEDDGLAALLREGRGSLTRIKTIVRKLVEEIRGQAQRTAERAADLAALPHSRAEAAASNIVIDLEETARRIEAAIPGLVSEYKNGVRICARAALAGGTGESGAGLRHELPAMAEALVGTAGEVREAIQALRLVMENLPPVSGAFSQAIRWTLLVAGRLDEELEAILDHAAAAGVSPELKAKGKHTA